MTPLNEGSALRIDFYLTTYNIHKTDIHVTGGFESPIPGNERPQTQALDRAAAGIGSFTINV